jgi:hypothetical protein
MLYLIAIWRPPPWLWNRLMGRVRASTEPQKLYPRLGLVLRTMYLTKRVLAHLRVMDFSITPGKTGYYAWKIGLVGLWQKRFTRRPNRPDRTKKQPEVKVGVQVISPDGMRDE